MLPRLGWPGGASLVHVASAWPRAGNYLRCRCPPTGRAYPWRTGGTPLESEPALDRPECPIPDEPATTSSVSCDCALALLLAMARPCSLKDRYPEPAFLGQKQPSQPSSDGFGTFR